jgi:hypothetical protein
MARNCLPKTVTTIYTLSDPRTNEIRYVGKTVSPLVERLRQHISTARRLNRTHNHYWINSIGTPIIEALEECEWQSSQERESYWISQMKAWGFSLVNHTSGGEGALGREVSKETREKQSKSLIKTVGKSVHQYTLDGTYIKSYDSISLASKATGALSQKIIMVCKGKRRKASGFRWSYDKVDTLGNFPIHKQTGRKLTPEHIEIVKKTFAKHNPNTGIDLMGQKFGRLFVIGKARTDRYTFWKCLCDCGVEKVICQGNLLSKTSPTKSCGCLRRRVNLDGQN